MAEFEEPPPPDVIVHRARRRSTARHIAAADTAGPAGGGGGRHAVVIAAGTIGGVAGAAAAAVLGAAGWSVAVYRSGMAASRTAVSARGRAAAVRCCLGLDGKLASDVAGAGDCLALEAALLRTARASGARVLPGRMLVSVDLLSHRAVLSRESFSTPEDRSRDFLRRGSGIHSSASTRALGFRAKVRTLTYDLLVGCEGADSNVAMAMGEQLNGCVHAGPRVALVCGGALSIARERNALDEGLEAAADLRLMNLLWRPERPYRLQCDDVQAALGQYALIRAGEPRPVVAGPAARISHGASMNAAAAVLAKPRKRDDARRPQALLVLLLRIALIAVVALWVWRLVVVKALEIA